MDPHMLAELIAVSAGELKLLRDTSPELAAEALSGRLHHVHAELCTAATRFCPPDRAAETWCDRYADQARSSRSSS